MVRFVAASAAELSSDPTRPDPTEQAAVGHVSHPLGLRFSEFTASETHTSESVLSSLTRLCTQHGDTSITPFNCTFFLE